MPVDRTRALTRDQIDALSCRDAPIREKTLWRLTYETATRAEEILALNVPDLDLPNKRARVISKGGATEWVHWQTGAALLLPRLLAGRDQGPVFLAERLPTRPVPSLDLCPVTQRARLSYRRAAEIFEQSTHRLAHPGAPKQRLAELGGWTLHQLRHSQLTHGERRGVTSDATFRVWREDGLAGDCQGQITVPMAARPGPWLTRHLGVLAAGASPAMREEYARRAATAAAYREAAGITDPEQAVALLPHRSSPELEDMRLAAIRALEIRDETEIIRGMTHGELQARTLGAERA